MAALKVSIPSKPGFVHVLRVVVAGAASCFDLPYDVIEELRLAVDEASSQLLSGTRSSTLELEVIQGEGSLELVISTDGQGSDGQTQQWPPVDWEASLSGRVLAALADEAVFERSGGRPTIRLVKRFDRVKP